MKYQNELGSALNLKLFMVGVLVFFMICCDRPTQVPEPVESPALEQIEDIKRFIDDLRYDKADSLIEVALEDAVSRGDTQSWIDIINQKAISLMERRRLDDARELLLENRERVEADGSVDQKIYTLIQLSNLHTRRNDPALALEMLDLATPLLDGAQDRRLKAMVYSSRASLTTSRDPVEAIRLSYEAIEYFLEEGDRGNEATLRNNIGLIYHQQSAYESAILEYERALEINRELGRDLDLSRNYNNMANSFSAKGDKARAVDYLHKAIVYIQPLGVSSSLIQCYYNLGQIFLDLHEYEEARAYFDRGYRKSESIRFPPGVMYHSCGLASAEKSLGRNSMASRYLLECRRLAEDLDNLELQNRTYHLEAHIAEESGDYRKASLALRKEYELSEEIARIRRNKEFEEIRIAHDVDLRIADNERLLQQLDFQDRLNRNQRLVLLLLILLLSLSVVSLLIFAQNKRKLEATLLALEEKNNTITIKNSQLSKLNKELTYLNNDKDRLIGIIVHDLRNPLFGLIGLLDVIGESVRGSAEEEHLELARESAYRLNSLINNLLDVHSLEKQSGDFEIQEVRVDELIRKVVKSQVATAMSKDMNIELDLDEVAVETHAVYLVRIADNLLSNAVKFSNPGTRIDVRVHYADAKKSFWKLEVIDQGPGFSREDQSRTFQMFGKLSARPTAGEVSTGLGLYTVKMLVERLGGSITLKSEQGKGSHFIIEFPVNHEKKPAD